MKADDLHAAIRHYVSRLRQVHTARGKRHRRTLNARRRRNRATLMAAGTLPIPSTIDCYCHPAIHQPCRRCAASDQEEM